MKKLAIVLITLMFAGVAMASDCVVEKSSTVSEYDDCDRRMVVVCHDSDHIKAGDKVSIRPKTDKPKTDKPTTAPCVLGIGD